MREATGDLNMTVIVFTAVALLSAVFFMVIWPMIKQELNDDASCADALCDVGYNDGGMAYCRNPETGTEFECPFRG